MRVNRRRLRRVLNELAFSILTEDDNERLDPDAFADDDEDELEIQGTDDEEGRVGDEEDTTPQARTSVSDDEENAAYALRLWLNRRNPESKRLFKQLFKGTRIKRKGRGDNASYTVILKGKEPILVGGLENAEETMSMAADERGETDDRAGREELLASTDDQEETIRSPARDTSDVPDGSDIEGVQPLGGNVYLVTDPRTGERVRKRGTEDEVKTWMATRSMEADAQERDAEFYDQTRAEDGEEDVLTARTGRNYGGLSFDKFFKDILDGKTILKYGKKAAPGTPMFKQIVAIQSLYNDMEFPGRQKKFEKITVDGKFGSNTREAIKDLQSFAKTMSGGFKNTKVDGIVGRQTMGLFDPTKSPLPITGQDVGDAMNKGNNLSESIAMERWQILAGI